MLYERSISITRYMLAPHGLAWNFLSLFSFVFLLESWAWRSAEVAHWFYRGEVDSEKIKSITSLFALFPVLGSPVSSISFILLQVPSGATGHYLLAVIYRYIVHGITECMMLHILIFFRFYIFISTVCRCTGRISAAAEQFTQALTLDPLLWAAYEELCILGWFILHPYMKFCGRSTLILIY